MAPLNQGSHLELLCTASQAACLGGDTPGARPWLYLDALKLRDQPSRRKDQVLWLGHEVWRGHLGSSRPGCASQKCSKDPKAEESFVTAACGSERSRKRSASRAVSS